MTGYFRLQLRWPQPCRHCDTRLPAQSIHWWSKVRGVLCDTCYQALMVERAVHTQAACERAEREAE